MSCGRNVFALSMQIRYPKRREHLQHQKDPHLRWHVQDYSKCWIHWQALNTAQSKISTSIVAVLQPVLAIPLRNPSVGLVPEL